jgi:hypothetical protein
MDKKRPIHARSRERDGRHPVLNINGFDPQESQRRLDIAWQGILLCTITICILAFHTHTTEQVYDEIGDLGSEMRSRDFDNLNRALIWARTDADAGDERVHMRVDAARVQIADLLEALRDVAGYPGCRTYLPPPGSPFRAEEQVCLSLDTWEVRVGVQGSWAERWQMPIRSYGSCEEL